MVNAYLQLHECNNGKQLILQLKRRTENLFHCYATMLLWWIAGRRSNDSGDHAALMPLHSVIRVWTTTVTI